MSHNNSTFDVKIMAWMYSALKIGHKIQKKIWLKKREASV